MEKFNRDFEKSRREFDRDFKRAQVFIFVTWVFFAIIGLSFTGFAVWVIIKLMQHFGVI